MFSAVSENTTIYPADELLKHTRQNSLPPVRDRRDYGFVNASSTFRLEPLTSIGSPRPKDYRDGNGPHNPIFFSSIVPNCDQGGSDCPLLDLVESLGNLKVEILETL